MALIRSGTIWLTARQTAERLSIALATLYNRRLNGGDLPPSYDIGGGRIRFDADEVEAWVRGRREGDRP